MGQQPNSNTSSNSSTVISRGEKLSSPLSGVSATFTQNPQLDLSEAQKQLRTLYNEVTQQLNKGINVQAKGSLDKELGKKNRLDLEGLINTLNQGLDKLHTEGKQQLITSEGTSENTIIVNLLKIIKHELGKNPDRQQSIESGIAQLRKNLSDTSTDKYLTFDPLRSDASLTPSNPSRPKR